MRDVTHALKTHPAPFAAILSGDKTCEFRRNDRDFQVGDTLRLEEYDPDAHPVDRYSGRYIVARISHVLSSGFGMPEGFAMLSFKGAIDQDGRVIR